MHLIATNLCEWLYVLVEETKHEIAHIETFLPNIHSTNNQIHTTHSVNSKFPIRENNISTIPFKFVIHTKIRQT